MICSSFLRFLVVIGIVILGPVFYSSISCAQIKTDEVIKKLDENYYYPQKKGLINIVARLEWEQQDMTSEKKTVLKKPDFQFNGKFKDGISRKDFMVSENRVILSDDEKTQYMRILNNYLDVFIPKTLHEKFFEYQGQTKFSGEGEMLLRFESSDPLDKAKYYELRVNTNKWRVAGLRVIQKHEPRSVEGKFFYTRKEGQWMVAEAFSSFTIDGQKYSEKTEYTYKNFKSFWLINKIRQTVQQDGHDIYLYKFRLMDYKINSMN